MTVDEFEALLRRRDALEREHRSACLILDEEGAGRGRENYDRCAELHAELTEVEEQIEAALAAERAAEERSDPASEAPPAA